MNSSFSMRPGQQRAQRSYYMEWGNDGGQRVVEAIKNFCGYTERAVSNYGNVWLARHFPHPHRYWVREGLEHSQEGFLYCEAVDIATDIPIGRDSKDVAYGEEAIIKASYWAPPYQFASDTDVMRATAATDMVPSEMIPSEWTLLRYVSFSREPIAKIQTIPNYGVVKFSDGTPATNLRGYPLFESDVTITWHQVPKDAIPWASIEALHGMSNAQTMGVETSIAGVFYQGTLLFGTMKPTYYKMGDGNWAADLAYRFRHYPRGADKALKFKQGFEPSFDYLVMDYPANTKLLVQQGDFKKLFTPV